MKVFDSGKIRNVCLLSHGGAGKTSLAEALLFNAGVVDRLGKVTEGTTTADFDPEEIKRKVSISSSLVPFEWKSHKINLIDSPGYFDFVGEVKQVVRVAETAVIVVSAKSGVSVGTEKSFDYASKQKISKVVFVNKMDDENANFENVSKRLSEKYGNGVIVLQIPIVENGKFMGYIDVLSAKAKKFDKGKVIDIEIPIELADDFEDANNKLCEAIAETNEDLMEKYFTGDEYTEEETKNGLKDGIKSGSIIPVYCGSAVFNLGVEPVTDAIVEFCPSPVDFTTVEAKIDDSEDYSKIKIDTSEKLAALVFKTVSDNFVGKISMVRVYSGTLKADSLVYNSETKKTEKVASLFMVRGKKQIPVNVLVAGDIGGIPKLGHTNTNDTLCEQSRVVTLEKSEFPEPSISLAIIPKTKGDEEKISSGLQKLQDEDKTFKVEINNETHQTLISGIGEQHLDVLVSKLKTRFGVSVDLIAPRIPYRETIKKKVKVEGKHKKQSGGHGQYGHVWVEFEQGDQTDLIFEEKIFGGSVPRQYFPAVEKGLRDSIKKGVLAGYPVVNLKATLLDGSYHTVDSSEMAFKIAAGVAYKKGLEQANPILLEPISHVEVYVPEHYMGDIIGDLNKRRGRILGMNPQDDGNQQVVAEVPQAEMFKYATDLRSMTHGRGEFRMRFERYEEAPANISQKVIEESKANEEH